jgi:hypothetical protein
VSEYYPLEPGRVLSYELRRGGGRERLTLEFLEGGRLRRTWTGADGARSSVETAERRADGVYLGGELVLPAKAGARWGAPPREYTLEGFSGRATVPAGSFTGCARVSYLIAGGDAGSGERFYAPGVGLVLETCRDESDPYETRLLRIDRMAP